MTDSEQLTILKKNLQQLSTANDDLLLHLLEQADRRLAVLGVKNDGSGDYSDTRIDMAAYLFRKRDKDEDESGMPVFLRREIHDLRIHQRQMAEEAEG